MEHFLENWKPKWNSFKESMYLLAKNKLSLLAFAIIILLLAGAISAPFIVPYPEDVYSTHIESKLQPPSEEHIMGTDDLGRDVFSRVVYATRVSISTALVAVGVALLIGIPLGAIAGVFGGWIDNVIMRITDIFLSFPPLLLAIALVALLGSGLTNAIIAIVVSCGPGIPAWFADRLFPLRNASSCRRPRPSVPARPKSFSSTSSQTASARSSCRPPWILAALS